MPRPATGTVRFNRTRAVWEVTITQSNGERSKPIAMTGLSPCSVSPSRPARGCSCGPCRFAIETGRRTSKEYRIAGTVPTETTLTVSEWFRKYHDAAAIGSVGRKNKGRPQASVEDRRARFRVWIEPIIGLTPMACVKPSDIRRIVQKLDEQIRIRTTFYAERDDDAEPHKGRKPGLSAKTAQNVFAELTSGFKEACNSKQDELRVLEHNPVKAGNVQPPTTTEVREQAALFPAELVQLLASRETPRPRRRCYWVACFTGMRRSELERLTARDVDLEHDLITVRGKKTSAAKRQVPIEPGLRPLLERLVKVRPTGPLIEVPRADGKGGASDLTKKDLERAGVTREDLSRDDAEHMPFTFHGCRHTAITHWAVAHRDQMWLLAVAGHTSADMTKRYLDKAGVVRDNFGTPHPKLPPDVIADLLSDLELPAEDPEIVLQRSETGVTEDKSKAGNPEEFPAVLTVAWRPQRELKATQTPRESTVASTPIADDSSLPSDPSDAKSAAVSERGDLDSELRALAKRYIDAGQIERAMAILGTLAPTKAAPVAKVVVDAVERFKAKG